MITKKEVETAINKHQGITDLAGIELGYKCRRGVWAWLDRNNYKIIKKIKLVRKDK